MLISVQTLPFPLRQTQTHTNAQHVKKKLFQLNPPERGVTLHLTGWLWAKTYLQIYWESDMSVGYGDHHVRPFWCHLQLTEKQWGGTGFQQRGLTHVNLLSVLTQAKYMVRRVSWWICTALAKACWSRPLLWPDVWLPSALKRQH